MNILTLPNGRLLGRQEFLWSFPNQTLTNRAVERLSATEVLEVAARQEECEVLAERVRPLRVQVLDTVREVPPS